MDDMEQRALELAEQYNKPSDEAVGHAMAEVVADPTKAVKTKITGQVSDIINTDEQVAKKVGTAAKKIVDNATEEAVNDSEKGVKRAIFENNESACTLIGVNEKTVPTWVVAVAKYIQAFWYGVWCVVASITVAPVVFLSQKIAIIFKKTWIAVLLALVIYLAVTFVPVLLKVLNIY